MVFNDITVILPFLQLFFSNTHLHSGEESLKTKRTITSHLMAYGVGNQSPGLKQAQNVAVVWKRVLSKSKH
jgi:hypothetical protein